MKEIIGINSSEQNRILSRNLLCNTGAGQFRAIVLNHDLVLGLAQGVSDNGCLKSGGDGDVVVVVVLRGTLLEHTPPLPPRPIIICSHQILEGTSIPMRNCDDHEIVTFFFRHCFREIADGHRGHPKLLQAVQNALSGDDTLALPGSTKVLDDTLHVISPSKMAKCLELIYHMDERHGRGDRHHSNLILPHILKTDTLRPWF
eukprot:gene14252-biopygen3884